MAGKKVRLKPEEAIHLGFEVKQRTKPDQNPLYYLNEQRLKEIQRYRGIEDLSDLMDLNLSNVKHLWVKRKEGTAFVTNPNYNSHLKDQFFEDLENFISDKSPKFEKIQRENKNEEHLLIINPADIHIGKLCDAYETGDEYNIEIAKRRVHEGVDGIIESVKGFGIDQLLFVGGNDILHIDTPKRTTTSGTPQDTDGMWYKAYLEAFKLYVSVLERLIEVQDVHFVFCPSNHDYQSGWFLCQNVATYFKDNPNITFDVSIAYRKYYTYGKNLIGFSHGDGGKIEDLALTMANECESWTRCNRRYIYVHHFHHKKALDKQSVAIETMRSPSGTDSWHHRSQYANNIKAIEGFLHHRTLGQVGRFTHNF